MTSRPAEANTPHAAEEYSALTGAVRDLVRLMHEGGISHLEVQRGDLKIALSAHHVPAPPVASALTAPSSGPSPSVAAEAAPEEDVIVITSPMIGTYYAGPAPGEPPFIHVGETVEVGQTVAIIEAMKIMNEIVAEHAGVVEQILVRDGEPVEYGHPLLRLRPTA